MNKPTVSVIIPVYNTEKWLRKCLDSIIEQSFGDFELILVNDGSTDGSLGICREYEGRDARVKVFDGPNQGSSAARNLGLDNASGEWLIFCDSDDWWDEEMLDKLYRAAMENKADIAACGFKIEKKDGSKDQLYPYSPEERKKDVMLIGGIYSSLCNKLIRTRLLKDMAIEGTVGVGMCDDLLISTPARFHSKRTVIVNEPLYHYNRLVESSICLKNEKDFSDHIRAAHILEKYFKDKNKKEDKIVKSILCNFQYRNKWRVGFEEWKKAFPHPVISMMTLKQYGRVATIKYLIACIMPVWAYKGVKRVFKRKKST